MKNEKSKDREKLPKERSTALQPLDTHHLFTTEQKHIFLSAAHDAFSTRQRLVHHVRPSGTLCQSQFLPCRCLRAYIIQACCYTKTFDITAIHQSSGIAGGILLLGYYAICSTARIRRHIHNCRTD